MKKETVFKGSLEITKENENDFGHISEVTGVINVYGSAKLDSLTTVGGYVCVYGSAKLDSQKLETVGGSINVYGSAKLDSLTTVGGYVSVSGSAKLDSLTTVRGNVFVHGSAKLDAQNLETVGGNVHVYGSAKLDSLTTVGGYVCVYGSAKLDSQKLETVGGYVFVEGSAKLDSLTTVGGGVHIGGSAKLDAQNLETVGGNVHVYSSATANIPSTVKSNLNNQKDTRLFCEKALNTAFLNRGLIKADKILSWVISKRKIKDVVIYKVKIVGALEFSYLVQKGEAYSHGKTIKDAKDSLKYKISSRDTTQYKSWKTTDTKTVEELIGAYRAIAGACEFGVREFCERQDLKKEYKLSEVFKMTDGHFGHNEFKRFFREIK